MTLRDMARVVGSFYISRKHVISWIAVILILCGTSVFTSCSDDDDSPVVHEPTYATLKEALVGINQISLIKADPDQRSVKKKESGKLEYKEQYSMLFRQDLDHEHDGGDTFLQRVAILFRGFDRPTILVTEGYSWRAFTDVEDLGINLNANMVHVEHRNFGESLNQDQGKWQYQTCAQASADLHAIYNALKPIFKGKWMCAGTSKSGEAAIDYVYFYPEDMTLAAAFCSPFNIKLFDDRYGHYLFNEVSTEENREIMKSGIRMGLENGEEGIYKSVCELMESANQPKPSFTEYVYELYDLFFGTFQYTQPIKQEKELRDIVANETSMRNRIWVNIISSRDANLYTYYVECVKEQGHEDPGYMYSATQLDGTSFNTNDYFKSMLKTEDHWLIDTYDNSVRLDQLKNFFTNSPCPILLFYSKDDPWTAGQPDKIGPNVKKIINPIGIHSSWINDTNYCPETTKKEVMDFVTTYIN